MKATDTRNENPVKSEYEYFQEILTSQKNFAEFRNYVAVLTVTTQQAW